jgi:hypothetical protein
MSRTRKRASSRFEAGFAREIITPAMGAPLAGYFNPRPNSGVLDELHVKAFLFRSGRTVTGVVSFDLLYLSRPLVNGIRASLRKHNLLLGDKLIFCATHTHTGPYVMEVYEGKADSDYVKNTIRKASSAVSRAYHNLAPAELLCASVKNNPFAYNRRYFMKSGTVVTNPGKCNPDIVRPEGTVDREIGVLGVKQDGRLAGLIANITNHTDTIGVNLVSADWPGRMERYVQRTLGHDVPVMILIGPSGNINHFDVSTRRNQTRYEEAKRIGRGYGKIVVSLLDGLKTCPASGIRVTKRVVNVPYRKIRPDELARAKKIVRQKAPARAGDLTSEELAKGDPAVARFFAKELLKFYGLFNGKKAALEFMSIGFGDRLAIASLPGEPFTEIGMAIKRSSPFRHTFVASLANDRAGYVPLEPCFSRGGYEILPVVGGGLSEDAADVFVRTSAGLLEKNR